MKNPVDHRDLEGIVVNLVNISAIAQTKPSRPSFDPFERRLFYPLLIFKNCVFLSAISMTLNSFTGRVFLFSIVPLRLANSSGCNFAGWWILDIRQR